MVGATPESRQRDLDAGIDGRGRHVGTKTRIARSPNDEILHQIQYGLVLLSCSACASTTASTQTDATYVGDATEIVFNYPDDSLPIPVIQLLRPSSMSISSTQQPVFRWINGESRRFRVLICRDRACLDVEQEHVVQREDFRPTVPLPAGAHFWYVESLDDSGVATFRSPIWQFRTLARSADRDTVFGQYNDFNGDGFSDMIVSDSRTSYVYYGSASGLQMGMALGQAMTGQDFRRVPPACGDFNGDGFSDCLVFEVDSASVRCSPGALHWGSAIGLDSTPRPSQVVFDERCRRIRAPSAVGDLDGDGYGDVLVVTFGLDGTAGVQASIQFGFAEGVGRDHLSISLPRPGASSDILVNSGVPSLSLPSLRGEFLDLFLHSGTGAETWFGRVEGPFRRGPIERVWTIVPGPTNSDEGIVSLGAAARCDLLGSGTGELVFSEISRDGISRAWIFRDGEFLSLREVAGFQSVPMCSPDFDGDGFGDLVSFGETPLGADIYPGSSEGLNMSRHRATEIHARIGEVSPIFSGSSGDYNNDGMFDVVVPLRQQEPGGQQLLVISGSRAEDPIRTDTISLPWSTISASVVNF